MRRFLHVTGGMFNAPLLLCVGTLPLSVHNTCYNYMMILTAIPVGISIASTTLVGNAVGANDPRSARHAAIATLIIEIVLAAVYGLATFAARFEIPKVTVIFNLSCSGCTSVIIDFGVIVLAFPLLLLLRHCRHSPLTRRLSVKCPICCLLWQSSWFWTVGRYHHR